MSGYTHRLHIDYETASAFDLRAGGAWAYACDPSTKILCLGFELYDAATDQILESGVLDMTDPRERSEARRLMLHPGVEYHAWNAFFEYSITSKVFPFEPGDDVDRVLDPRRWHCTMARAAYWGLPMRLEDAGAALGATVQKDKAGHALMMKLCRPLNLKTNDTNTPWDWSQHTPDALSRLRRYCGQDVSSEVSIYQRTPDLPDQERRVWLADFYANRRGVMIDRQAVERLQELTDSATNALDREMQKLTNGKVPSARNAAKLQKWLTENGVVLPDLRRPTVQDALKSRWLGQGLPTRRALQIRLDTARSSTAKLTRMIAAAPRPHDEIRGLLQYYGAGRTGRWAGRLVQPQNMPRASIKKPERALEFIRTVSAEPADVEMMFPDSALGVVSACLRSCFVARPGWVFISGDLSQIEARMVAWLAGQTDVLDVFASGKDIYVYTAKKQGSDNRQFGKVLVLACGFGMGPDKFRDTAASYGVMLTPEQAEDAVRGWRAGSPKIVSYWYACDDAARAIASGSAKRVVVGPTVFERVGKSMLITLPSGRQLIYRGIGIEPDPRTGRDSIIYFGLDQKTRKWTKLRTYGGKIVENITQAAARDVMADAFVELTFSPIPLGPVLTVHDELLCEAPDDGNAKGHLKVLLNTMSQPVKWAPGLPVAAEGWTGKHYRK